MSVWSWTFSKYLKSKSRKNVQKWKKYQNNFFQDMGTNKCVLTDGLWNIRLKIILGRFLPQNVPKSHKMGRLKRQNAHFRRFLAIFGCQNASKLILTSCTVTGPSKYVDWYPYLEGKNSIAVSKNLKKLVSWGSCFFVSRILRSQKFFLLDKSS